MGFIHQSAAPCKSMGGSEAESCRLVPSYRGSWVSEKGKNKDYFFACIGMRS